LALAAPNPIFSRCTGITVASGLLRLPDDGLALVVLAAPTSHPPSNSTLDSTAVRSTVRSKRCGQSFAAACWVYGFAVR
jgi:hypothetical protein